MAYQKGEEAAVMAAKHRKSAYDGAEIIKAKHQPSIRRGINEGGEIDMSVYVARKHGAASIKRRNNDIIYHGSMTSA